MLGVVLAAGKGTRMAPLTPERPKALVPTFDAPQLAWVLGALARAGVERAWVNAHADHERLARLVAEQAQLHGMTITLSHEKAAPLGTAGALKALAAALSEPFIVANADVACDMALPLLIEAHTSARAPATLTAIPVEDDADFFVDQSWVVDLIDRREEVRAGHRYGGIGVFEPEVLRYIPEGGSGLFETVMKGLIADRAGLAALEWAGYWMDIATPLDHLKANLDVLSGGRDPRITAQTVGEGWARWDVHAYVGAGAMVDNVDLRHAVVGKNAVIAANSFLERCVVWDGAKVPKGNYRESIITRTQVLPIK
ncbi:MAG: NDP-sugar synthase [Actinomycetota bacterium]